VKRFSTFVKLKTTGAGFAGRRQGKLTPPALYGDETNMSYSWPDEETMVRRLQAWGNDGLDGWWQGHSDLNALRLCYWHEESMRRFCGVDDYEMLQNTCVVETDALMQALRNTCIGDMDALMRLTFPDHELPDFWEKPTPLGDFLDMWRDGWERQAPS
jgi:hypothetical protein